MHPIPLTLAWLLLAFAVVICLLGAAVAYIDGKPKPRKHITLVPSRDNHVRRIRELAAQDDPRCPHCYRSVSPLALECVCGCVLDALFVDAQPTPNPDEAA